MFTSLQERITIQFPIQCSRYWYIIWDSVEDLNRGITRKEYLHYSIDIYKNINRYITTLIHNEHPVRKNEPDVHIGQYGNSRFVYTCTQEGENHS